MNQKFRISIQFYLTAELNMRVGSKIKEKNKKVENCKK
jgi:hypothetical protein